MVSEAIDFRYLLIENYKKLKLTENELVTIFVIDHLIGQGNTLITADLLALKMSLSSSDIDKILASLFKKKMIDYVTVKNNTVTTLDPLKEKLYSEFQISLKQRESKKILSASYARQGLLYDSTLRLIQNLRRSFKNTLFY